MCSKGFYFLGIISSKYIFTLTFKNIIENTKILFILNGID